MGDLTQNALKNIKKIIMRKCVLSVALKRERKQTVGTMTSS